MGQNYLVFYYFSKKLSIDGQKQKVN